MSNPVSQAKAMLDKLLADDVIQVRPSDRDRFMKEWREAMGDLHTAEGMIEVTYFDVAEKLPKAGMDDDDHGQIWAQYPGRVDLVTTSQFYEHLEDPDNRPLSWARTGLIANRS